MRVGAIDIGTNTVRLLVADVVDGVVHELAREVEVVGLGAGVDRTRQISEESLERAASALERFAGIMRPFAPERARAIATSATRDAHNRDAVLDRLEAASGVRPDVIGGDEEATLSFVGATLGRNESCLVIDPGGGSTEFVFGTEAPEYALSVDIGSVRLTDRCLPDHPASAEDLTAAREHAAGLFAAVTAPGRADTVVGVAGTFTTLATLHRGAPASSRVDGTVLTVQMVDELVDRLGGLTVEETAALPSLDPRRAPVILGGAIVVSEALRRVDASEVVVSERDSLDGIALGLSRA